ncbi:UNVERIFIED_CONTAM: hypothetical protein FKN15_041107 [Acipenser sinensis]
MLQPGLGRVSSSSPVGVSKTTAKDKKFRTGRPNGKTTLPKYCRPGPAISVLPHTSQSTSTAQLIAMMGLDGRLVPPWAKMAARSGTSGLVRVQPPDPITVSPTQRCW